MIYGYIRVSSDKQTVENQRFEINKFCDKQKIEINGWIEETISGTKAYNKSELGKLLKKVQKDDIIICSELSRGENASRRKPRSDEPRGEPSLLGLSRGENASRREPRSEWHKNTLHRNEGAFISRLQCKVSH